MLLVCRQAYLCAQRQRPARSGRSLPSAVQRAGRRARVSTAGPTLLPYQHSTPESGLRHKVLEQVHAWRRQHGKQCGVLQQPPCAQARCTLWAQHAHSAELSGVRLLRAGGLLGGAGGWQQWSQGGVFALPRQQGQQGVRPRQGRNAGGAASVGSRCVTLLRTAFTCRLTRHQRLRNHEAQRRVQRQRLRAAGGGGMRRLCALGRRRIAHTE